MNELILNGCSPTPLANYLKALGILRIIDDQLPEAGLRGYWKNESFVICGDLDEATLTEFFLYKYAASAVVAPWNGGSGFYPKENAVRDIQNSSAKRFAPFRKVIRECDKALEQLNLKEKPLGEVKNMLLSLCRNTFPDTALGWLDAAFVLTKDGTRYPPLLGTGGNDGRLDFTNNFMQQLCLVLDTETGEPINNALELLNNALFDHTVRGLSNKKVGQFSPASAGGSNTSSGFSGKSLINPWNFILMLEGAILFAAASVKRLQTSSIGQLAYPFSVRTTGAGYGSASEADEADSRCEMWMPLWTTPTTCTEIRNLLSEGRAQVGMRPARDGLDFYRAITNLGVDRGISAFQRYGFLKRNGDAHYATPMERVTVQRNESASELLSDLDRNNWLDTFRKNARADNSPGSVLRASRQLERAIIGLCTASQQNAALQIRELLVALGRCEQALANSIAWTKKNNISPAPLLGHRWLSEATALDDPSNVEFRLAASLASLNLFGSADKEKDKFPFRKNIEPLFVPKKDERDKRAWATHDSRNVVNLNGHLPDRLNQIIHRRLLLSAASGHEGWQETSSLTAQLSDVATFIEGSCDTKRLTDFLAGLALLNWADPKVSQSLLPPTNDLKKPSAAFALLKLCHQAPKKEGSPIPLDQSIHRFAAAGQIDTAVEKAIRRLKSSGLSLAVTELKGYVGSTEHLAAALLFPLWSEQIKQLEKIVHAPAKENHESSNSTTTESNIL